MQCEEVGEGSSIAGRRAQAPRGGRQLGTVGMRTSSLDLRPLAPIMLSTGIHRAPPACDRPSLRPALRPPSGPPGAWLPGLRAAWPSGDALWHLSRVAEISPLEGSCGLEAAGWVEGVQELDRSRSLLRVRFWNSQLPPRSSRAGLASAPPPPPPAPLLRLPPPAALGERRADHADSE